ncbi:MAG: response regulator [Butyrivibrio sp.]|nr:response regulator [Butyrivibrio sp.]
MNILVVDDEMAAIRDASRIIKKVEPEADIFSTEEAEEAIEICRENDIDVVFLDINMPDMDGLTLAAKLKNIKPMINIIMLTAYPMYALDAFRLWASAYLLKPVREEDVRNALKNLRNPVERKNEGVYIQCFGNFEIFFDGEIVKFGRSKAKEMLAYLVDRRGATASNSELRAVLWEDEAIDDEKNRKYFAQIVHDLKNTLEKWHCEDIFDQKRDSYAIVPSKITCDYYLALEKDPGAIAKFNGEYMSQYTWAYKQIGNINEKIGK